MTKGRKYTIGIDEVGRGSLAGPVTVAAVLLPRNFQFSILNFQRNLKIKLKDSKKLSPKQREIWFRYIKNHPDIFYAKASVSPKVIDRMNIAKAANLAASRALARLIANCRLPIKNYRIFLDGGLSVNKPMTNNLALTTKNLKLKTIIRGDEKIPAIMLASIVAKVSRDRKMKKLHFQYPHYDFINNMGYGTKRHIKAIRRRGPSEIHRLTFLNKYYTIKSKFKSQNLK